MSTVLYSWSHLASIDSHMLCCRANGALCLMGANTTEQHTPDPANAIILVMHCPSLTWSQNVNASLSSTACGTGATPTACEDWRNINK